MHTNANLPFIVCASIGALLNVVPLPKLIATGNVGASMLIVWTELACLFQFANAIRWRGNFKDWAPRWCDFCGYFFVAADVALLGAGVSINRRLYMFLTSNPKRAQKRFNAFVDIVFCLVIPLVSVALEYVVQQYRYYILENVGCIPGVGSIDLAFPLVWMLPLLVGIVLAGYACCIIRVSLQRPSRVVPESGQKQRSRRLMAIAVISVLYGLVPTSMAIALTATAYPVSSWPGWKAVHSTIDDVVYVPAQEWDTNSTRRACVELRRWIIVSLPFAIFLFLGSTKDIKIYWALFRGNFGQVSSMIGAVPEHNSNNPSEGHPHGSFEKTPAERRRTSLGLADRSRLDANLESIKLALPPPVTHSISPQDRQ